MSIHLHIVTSDFPNGIDNPQLSDAFFLIKALSQQKINIHLHSFVLLNEEPSVQLTELCSSISFYQRDKSNISLKADLPYHVSTRSSQKLIERLNEDEFPILFMGLSSSYPIYGNQLSNNRKFAVRLNKNEVIYYQQLAALVPWKGKKVHYQVEAWRMKNFLKKLIAKKVSLFISSDEMVHGFKPQKPSQFNPLALFTGMPPVFHQAGNGHFCLFYGRLSDEETAYAAFWLLQHVFNTLEIPFVIAGSHPSTHLENAAHVRQHTCLVSNPGEKEMQDLIKKAQIVLSPAFIQHEEDDHLLQALALGKHVLINPKSSKKTQAIANCHLAQSPEEFIEKTRTLFETPFSEEEKYARQQLLNAKFQDEKSLEKLTSWLS
jgi:UDP-N-acetylglucosamine transferase subunit ALG13